MAKIYSSLDEVLLECPYNPIKRTNCLDITNKNFTYLTAKCRVETPSHIKKKGGSYWACECKCGNFIVVRLDRLTSGNTRSCGCFQKEQTSQYNRNHCQGIVSKNISFKEEDGYIYVLNLFNYYKIGKTSNIEKRYKYFTDFPEVPIFIIKRKVSDYHNVELQLHNMFKEKRTNGEWFKLTQEDLKIIEEYLDNCQVDNNENL